VPLNAQRKTPGVPCEDTDSLIRADRAPGSDLGSAGLLIGVIVLGAALGIINDAGVVLPAFTCGTAEFRVTVFRLAFASAALP